MGRLDLSSSKPFLILLAFVIVLGAIVVYRLRRDIEEDDGATTEADLLHDLEQAYYAGEMDEDEFRRVTEAVSAKKSAPPATPQQPAPIVVLPEPPAVEAKPEELP